MNRILQFLGIQNQDGRTRKQREEQLTQSVRGLSVAVIKNEEAVRNAHTIFAQDILARVNGNKAGGAASSVRQRRIPT